MSETPETEKTGPAAEGGSLPRFVGRMDIRVGGHRKILKCISLNSWCGSVTDGVAFEFGDEGGWVVDYRDLVRVAEMAKAVRNAPNPEITDR